MADDDAPKTPPAPATEPSRALKQITLNVSHYAAVYTECRKSARNALGDRASEEEVLEVTRVLFDRFCQDQADVANETKKNADLKQMLQPMLAMLERRGLYM